jgi:membrane-associated phospholipid phosphatase
MLDDPLACSPSLPSPMAPAFFGAAAERRARARAAASAALITLVVGGQLLTLGELAGVPWPHASIMLPLVLGVAPLLAAGWVFLRGADGPPFASGAALAVPAWLFWGACYYLAASLTDPARTRVLDEGFAARLPFVPALTPLYLGVHPLSVLPFARAESREVLRRTGLGFLVILALSLVAWLSIPVAFPRSLAAGDGLGGWVLTALRGSDPPVNCLPSTHCAMAAHAAFRLRGAGRLLAGWSALTAALIAVSTMMLRQHYPVDVVAGVALGLGVAWPVDRWA